MEIFTSFEKIFIKDRLKNGLDRFFEHVGIKDIKSRKEIVRIIMEEIDKKEYFNEEEFIAIVDNILGKYNFQDKLDQVLPKLDNKRTLNPLLQKNIESYFKISKEKKGVNFRDKLNTRESVRAYLYLTLPEGQREVFKSDFERLLTQKKEFYFRLWPPKIGLKLRELIGGEVRGDFEFGEFSNELISYIEDLQKGKNKITLYFDEDLLPEELKEKSLEDLEKLGIKKNKDNYEIYIFPNNIQDILFNLAESSLLITEKETEIGRKLTRIKELFKKTRKNLGSLSEGKFILTSYAGLIEGFENSYREALKKGMSEEEAKKLLETANKLEKILEQFAEDSQDEQKRKIMLRQAGNWLKVNGLTFLSSIGFWWLAVSWFLPLWLIVKMSNQIDDFLKQK